MTRIHMAIGFMAALASLPNAQAQPAAPPLDALVFASIAGNACQARETRHTCFVRYTVGRITPASPAGTSPYKFTNSNLQCPAGYSPSVSFDNKLQDTARPNDSIHYYDAANIFPVPETRLAELQAGNFACAPSGAVVARYDTATEANCDRKLTPVMNVNGNMAQRSKGATWRQDTYNTGSQVCQHYFLAGCPAWCSRWNWATYEYTYLRCTRAAGAYLENNAAGQAPSASSTPTVVICDKKV